MKRTLIEDSSKKIGETVLLQGWVQVIRDQKNIKFIILRDISGIIQVVVTKDQPQPFGELDSITLESVISVEGLVKSVPQAPRGIEVQAEKIVVLSKAVPELPIPVIEKGEQETEQSKRLDWRWIDLRKPKNALIFKVWTAAEKAFIDYWISHGFLEIHSPKLMSTPSESGAELFSVPYFDTTAYLAQSPQFYKQMAMASGFEKIFEIGPVFRANPSFTSRHDTEFTGYDMEISFVESHQDIIQAESELIAKVLESIKGEYGQEIKEVFGAEIVVPSLPFPQVTMAEAKLILKEKGVESEKEGDLSPEEERELARLMTEKNGHEFLFVTEYPAEVRPFYHMRLESGSKLTKSFDLVWKGLEITTGAQREHRYEIIAKQAEEKGLSLKSIEHYLNFFKYGCPPHGGLGFGPSRFIMKMLNLSNVRDVTYLYRGVNRLTP